MAKDQPKPVPIPTGDQCPGGSDPDGGCDIDVVTGGDSPPPRDGAKK